MVTRLDGIRRKLDLTGGGEDPMEWPIHRPLIRIWADDADDFGPPHIAISIGAMYGQPTRYLELSSAEARTLARLLVETAEAFDAAVAENEPGAAA